MYGRANVEGYLGAYRCKTTDPLKVKKKHKVETIFSPIDLKWKRFKLPLDSPVEIGPSHCLIVARKQAQVFSTLKWYVCCQTPPPSFPKINEHVPFSFLQEAVDKAYQIVELKILSNWGNPEYTCLYRFRVHGRLAQ